MLDEFISQNTGKVVSYDNVPALAGQSPQLVASWCHFIGLPFQWADAYNWWDDSDANFLDFWEKVVNNRKDAEQLPSPGDIIVFDSSLPGSGGFGHLSIFVQSNGPNSWVGYDANWGGKSAHLQSHNWAYVLGWFTPKNKDVINGRTPTPLSSEAPSLAYDIEIIKPKTITLKNDALLFNLNDVDWESFQQNVQGQSKEGTDIVVSAIARHRLGGTYYMPVPEHSYGYRSVDCEDYDGSGVDNAPEDKIHKKKDLLPKGPVFAPILEGFNVEKEIPKYASMGDAANGVNSVGVVSIGTYYPYKKHLGMLCITAQPGKVPGWWINPDDLLDEDELLKKNWRTTYAPFRDQYGNIKPRYYRALNNDTVVDLDGRHKDLGIARRQPILIRGKFIGPDGVKYGRPDDCVSSGLFWWYGARMANLERIPDEDLETERNQEMVIEAQPEPRFRDKLVTIVTPHVGKIYDILKPKK